MALTIAPFYNVTNAVGPGGVNGMSDVYLVQYMLFNIMVDPKPYWTRNTSALSGLILKGGPEGLFPFTGSFTPRLGEWIEAFQRSGNARGYGPMSVDGKVNRAPVGWGKPGGRQNSWFTIQAMNLALIRMNPSSFANFSSLSDLPGSLPDDLSRTQFDSYD